ncbi:10884_t:CDS:2 [Ambispora leptoticha]|uniref:10884_t:CDS:1 n=1 Tax=Ambispora leptoticha TaxID=144679 RepID=A0A9N9B622_9GLOM|nr:10884_t:CDS:2 [Ambispora leptoticha]
MRIIITPSDAAGGEAAGEQTVIASSLISKTIASNQQPTNLDLMYTTTACCGWTMFINIYQPQQAVDVQEQQQWKPKAKNLKFNYVNLSKHNTNESGLLFSNQQRPMNLDLMSTNPHKHFFSTGAPNLAT